MNSHQRALHIVRQVGEISFVGNVIPHSWYHHLIRPNGKPYVVAIILLAEVVYWYRPEAVKDESSGRLLGIRKKFAGDKYRTSYHELAERFGFGHDQVIDAIDYLQNFGVLTKEVRQRVVIYGKPKGNVLFLEPVPDRLEQISVLPDTDAESGAPLPEESGEGLDADPSQPSLFAAQGQPTRPSVDTDAIHSTPSPEKSREGHGKNPGRLPGRIRRGSRGESGKAPGRNPGSLKGTKTPPQSESTEEGEPLADGETVALLRNEGMIAIEKYADLPAAVVRAAFDATRLPVGHQARPGFAARRLDGYRAGNWSPRTPTPSPAPAPPSGESPQPGDGVWPQVLAQLARAIPPGEFTTYVESSRLLLLDPEVAVVGAPHCFARDALQTYRELIIGALGDVTGSMRPIEFVIGADP